MESTRRVVVQVEVTSGQRPIEGIARGGDGHRHPFSGWSELFAILQQLTAEPSGTVEPDERP
jgi:hypothetical protein